MATITGLTAERMQEIEAASIIDAEIVGGNLILTKHDGTTINAGPVIGPPGPTGPVGPASVGAVPGEVKLWSGSTLPDLATYGKWVWADGAYYPVATHPKAAAHIAPKWRTFDGASDPGAANFRVPDLRGLVPAGLDAMPGGTRASRMTRAVAIILGEKTGRETYDLKIGEMPSHAHGGSVSVGVNVNVSGGISGSTDTQGYHSHPGAGGAVFAMGLVQRPQGSGSNQSFPQGSSGTTGDAGSHAHNVGGSFSGSGSGSGSGAIAAEGSNGAHETVQPTVMVPYIVYLDVV
jgi:microcystin-dependent protein